MTHDNGAYDKPGQATRAYNRAHRRVYRTEELFTEWWPKRHSGNFAKHVVRSLIAELRETNAR